jgi:nitrite reductase/ring-hydroxylating ferredoxin subunit
MSASQETWVRVARVSEVQATGVHVVQAGRYTIALFAEGDRIYAVDNRCPHMGFPLCRGTLRDGLLTCHWHHARFDLQTGGTFDLWADDLIVFPVEIRGDEVWVNLSSLRDARERAQARLEDGLKHALPLVLAKAVLRLLDLGEDPVEIFRVGLAFGVRHQRGGWGPGLTILTAMMNMLPHLDPSDRPLALYHGLAAVAADVEDSPPRFPVRSLPGASDPDRLQRWFRQFVEVRDAEGAERCLASAVAAGLPPALIAGMIFAATTDHRYLATGHALDFVNKAFEALEITGWADAGPVLTSLVPVLVRGQRMEENAAWRHPVDLVGLLERAFEALPALRPSLEGRWAGPEALLPVLLGEDPEAIVEALLSALREGAPWAEVAGTVALAAALRIVRFSLHNEHSDWDTALHTFSFANAVHQAMRRFPSPALLRGVFDAAMSVYLDRFLNVPPAPFPEPRAPAGMPDRLMETLAALLDRQGAVQEAASVVAGCLQGEGNAGPVRAALGHALLREDRDFHTIQMVEAAFQESTIWRGTPWEPFPLIAAARYLAAHAPTRRAQEQIYRIAERLRRGERLYEDA